MYLSLVPQLNTGCHREGPFLALIISSASAHLAPMTFHLLHSLVFCRKDLCEAKHETERSSKKQTYPPVEASGGQVQCYIRSSSHSEECNGECSGQADVPPVVASGGQEQCYIRSSSHSEECN